MKKTKRRKRFTKFVDGVPRAHPRAFVVWVEMPPAALSPNARRGVPWRFAVVARYREHVTERTEAVLAAGQPNPIARQFPRWETANVRPTFVMPTRRPYDPDNLIARLKSGYDGLADAGLLADDSGVTHHPPIVVHEPDDDIPIVRLEIWP